MKADDLHFEKSKLPCLENYIERIEQLFHVNLTIVENDDRFACDSRNSENLSASVHISSDISPDCVQEAKGYISSLLEEAGETQRLTLTYNVELLTMVQEQQDEIEKKSQAVVKINPEKCEICIQGQSKCALYAKDMIERMVRVKCSDLSLTEEVRTRGGFSDRNQNDVDVCTDCAKLKSSTEMITTKICENKSKCGCCEEAEEYSSLQVDCAPSDLGLPHVHVDTLLIKSKEENGEPCRTSCLDRENSVICDSDLVESNSLVCDIEVQKLSKKVLSSQSSCSTSSGDDVSDHEQNLLEDRTKIEFALKLGYSEQQLIKVLKKLGPNAGKNEILSELISLVSADQEDSDSDSDDGWSEHNHSDDVKFGLELSDLGKSIKEKEGEGSSKLHPIVIDGSNVAMSHGNKEIFSCKGIQLAVDWFRERGHDTITVFVPQWRKETSRPDSKITDQEILFQLEREKVVVFTPARRIGGKRVVCYDDRYILNLAVETGAIVVSNDNYRDLVTEKAEYRKVVEERLLMYSFVNDRFMPPDDPLGRYGPSLDNFLSREPKQPDPLPPLCPYGSKKCTYGNKCKFYHPERGNNPHRSVTDKLAEQTKQKLQEIRDREKGEKKKQPLTRKSSGPKMALQRTRSLVPGGTLPSSLIKDTPMRKSTNDLTEDFAKKAEIREQEDIKLKEYKKCLAQAELKEKRKQESKQRKKDEEMEKHSNLFSGSHLCEGQGSRSSSPMQRKSQSPKPKPQEQFLISGHLMLAKKLSDEAGDSKLQHSEEEPLSARSPPSVRSPVTVANHQQPLKEHQPLSIHQSLTQAGGHFVHRPLSVQKSTPLPVEYQQQTQAPNRHKKLTRQFSLQGAHDPRLVSRGQPGGKETQNVNNYPHSQQMMQAQYGQPGQTMYHPGYTPTQMPIREDGQSMNSSRGHDLRAQVMSHQAYQSGDSPLQNRQHLGLPSFGEHSSVARMLSAPEVVQSRQKERPPRMTSNMVRQNSSSDTQLHMIGDTEQLPFDYCLFPGANGPLNPSAGGMPGHTAQSKEPVYERRDPFQGVNQEYRSQHQYGETRWTFDPVFGVDHGSFAASVQPKEGIDAFESDYPSSDLRCRGPDPWQNTQNQYFRSQPRNPVGPKNYIHSNQDQFQQMMSQRPNVLSKRPLSRNESLGFNVHQPVEHVSLSVPSFRTYDQSYRNLGAIGHEQKSNAVTDNSYSFGQYSLGPNVRQTHTSVSNLDSGSGVAADDAPIHPTDKRYNLYYHLCGLFAEHKVRAVMNQHPEETNPQELCAYIIGAK